MKCDFKVGDKIVCSQNGGKMCARILSISGSIMDIDIYSPKIGKVENMTIGGWNKICVWKHRDEASRVGN